MPVRISKNRVALENIPLNEAKGADIASAGTVNLDSATGNLVHITGTTTITAITLASGSERTVIFDGSLTLTHNATTLILPGSANITTAAGDRAIFRGDGSGNTRCISYTKASGTAVVGSSNKNVIIGGNFTTNPWQRGTSFTAPANNVYTADRFVVSHSSDAVVDILKTADAPTAAEAGMYTAHCLHADVTTLDATIAAGQLYIIQQRIEGYNVADLGFGQAGARNVTLSFWVKATKTGTYCVSFVNSALDRSYVAEYTVSTTDTWEKKTITIAVDTIGTWLYDTGLGLRVSWAIACGSTYQTTAGSWAAGQYYSSANQVNALDSASNNFKLALIQLEVGQTATSFEYRSIGQEIALCQRYYEKSSNLDTDVSTVEGFVGLASGAANFRWFVPFRTRKRAAPTITTYNSSVPGSTTTLRNYTAVSNETYSSVAAQESFYFLSHNASTSNHMYTWSWVANAEL